MGVLRRGREAPGGGVAIATSCARGCSASATTTGSNPTTVSVRSRSTGKARVESDGDKVAEVPKRWLRARDTYGVEVHRGSDPVLILAITVAVDAMSHD
jgi:hypothetical protein